MMKRQKITALLLSLCLLLSLGTAAFATGEASGGASGSEQIDDTHLDTLVVDGVEVPYDGTVPANGLLITTERYSVGSYTKPYRTAIYADDGVVAERSVVDAITGGAYDDAGAQGITVRSENENFNGVIVTGGEYTIADSEFYLNGNGGSDFQGFGAAIFASGEPEVTVDNVIIDNDGMVRTALVIDGNAKVFVKDSVTSTKDGIPEEGYVGNAGITTMKSVPWVLGLDGNARGTNLLTDGTSTYLNCIIQAEKWGVLSFDGCSTGANLIFVNSTAAITGGLDVDVEQGPSADQLASFDFYIDNYKDDVVLTSDGHPSGYGTLIIGDMLGVFAGSTVYTPTYACILANEGPTVVYTGSDADALNGITDTLTETNSAFLKDNPDYEVYKLDEVLDEAEARNTVVYSDRIGIMSYDDFRASNYDSCGTIIINDGTEFYTGGSTMVIKGFPVNIYVDDATLVSGSGVILQVEDCDDPGQGTDDRASTQVFNIDYEELTANNEDTRVRTRTMEELNDLTTSTSLKNGDHLVTAVFSNMEELAGDMYNGSGSNESYNNGGAIMNMYVVLDNVADYSGAISASHSFHKAYTYTYTNDQGQEVGVIAAPDWFGDHAASDWFAENGWTDKDVSWHYMLSDFVDIASPVVDNGVIVELKNGTVWTVTGESYLTKLIVGEGCEIDGTMTVDGVAVNIQPGEYEGDIIINQAVQ